MRAREVDRWSQSEQFKLLVAANRPSSSKGGSLQQLRQARSGSLQ
jgi:hypothetical protein